jgi:hypothetical protein
MTAVCPSCGHEFSGTRVSSAVAEFFAKLDALDSQAKDTGASSGVLGMLAGGINESRNEKRKLGLIEAYPIPNTKEDILEFVIMASSRIDTRSPGEISPSKRNSVLEYNKAWKSKLLQAHSKAKIVFGNDKAALSQVEAAVTQIREAEKKAKRKVIFITLLSTILGAGLIFLVVIMFNGLSAGPKGAKQEAQRLEALYSEIVTDVNDGNLPGAKLKAAGLFYGYDSSGWDGGDITKAQTEVWDKKRDALLKEIETLQAQKK